MKLVVTLPAYNEEKTVADVIRKIPRDIPGITRLEVVVVNDGSTDRTAQLSQEAGAIVVTPSRRRGLGAVFKEAKKKAMALGADIMVSIDSDGQFDPTCIPALVKPIVDSRADFVTATRFAVPELIPVMPKAKLWGNLYMTRLINFLSKGNCALTDVSCGFRAYSKEALLRLNLFGKYTYTQEVILSLALGDMRLSEVPVKVRGQREFGKSRVAHNLFIYGTQTLKIILRTYRDYQPLRFFMEAALACFVPALLLASIAVINIIVHHRVSPHKWAAIGAGILFINSLFLAVTGLLADMNHRTRLSLEELLIHQRRREMEKNSRQQEPAPKP